MELFRPLWELVNGEAYRPDTINGDVRIPERFAGRSLLAVSLRGSTVSAVKVKFDKRGQPSVGEAKEFEWGVAQSVEAARNFVVRAAADAGTKDVMVVSARIWGGARHAEVLFQGPDRERNRLLLEDPSRVVGENVQGSNQVCAVGHPTVNRSVILTYEKKVLEMELELLADTGLRVVRLQNSIYSMLRYVVEEMPSAVREKDILVVDGSTALLVFTNEADWDDLGFIADVKSADQMAHEVKELLSRRPNPTRPLVWISSIEINVLASGLDGGQSERLLPGKNHVDIWCACSEGKDRVATDLNPEPGVPRQHLPVRLRGAAYFAMVFIVGGAVANVYTNLNVARETAAIKAVVSEIDNLAAERARIAEQIARVESDRTKADLMGRWVSLGLSVQPIIVSTVNATGNSVALDEFSLKTWDGAPQLEFKVVARGDLRRVNEFISHVSSNLADAGFKLSNPDQTAAPGGNGIQYVGRYNYPSPANVIWTKEASK
jgi:hypothetical protein